MFTANQLVAHAVGDYILQSDWMADNKTKSSYAAALHAITYTFPFLFITASPLALLVICVTHFFIDRFRLARYVVWLKNGPLTYAPTTDDWRWQWKPLTATGYADTKPPWLSTWLYIIADNILHVICNALAIWYFI